MARAEAFGRRVLGEIQPQAKAPQLLMQQQQQIKHVKSPRSPSPHKASLTPQKSLARTTSVAQLQAGNRPQTSSQTLLESRSFLTTSQQENPGSPQMQELNICALAERMAGRGKVQEDGSSQIPLAGEDPLTPLGRWGRVPAGLPSPSMPTPRMITLSAAWSYVASDDSPRDVWQLGSLADSSLALAACSEGQSLSTPSLSTPSTPAFGSGAPSAAKACAGSAAPASQEACLLVLQQLKRNNSMLRLAADEVARSLAMDG